MAETSAPGSPQLPEILRPLQAAAALTISVRTLYRLVEDRAIGYIRVSEHGLRFRRDHLTAYLAAHTHEPKKEDR